MSNEEIEIEILRERLKELRDLLSVSHRLIFEPHRDIAKRGENLALYRQRLIENGIVEEQKHDRNRV